MHIVPNAQDKVQEGVKEWVDHDGLPHIKFLWASGEHVVLYQCWPPAWHGGHCPTSPELFIKYSSRTSLCLNSCGKAKQKSLGDFCRAAASLAHDGLMDIRAHRRWTKEEITRKGSQKIRHCSRHGCWCIKNNPAGMQNIVAAKHIPWKLRVVSRAGPLKGKKCSNGSKMGKLCQVRTKVTRVPVSMLARTALPCLWERTYGHGHTYTDTCSAQAHTSQGASSDLHCPASDATGIRWCCWLRLQLVLLPKGTLLPASHS